eukprot:TRINITY_DN18043_c0_g1_i1.p1 TRINITY_DN18043_c0_g1~~TRINITY_DN18043_c0_g1_i1.p1  ORF type:complete len:282 (+),score=64.15 TRINITY_DN18043_c0_g1_i1:83-928(+)
MANVRGNTYSMTNTNYPPSDDEFWAWSYDEMAQYDLPSVISYALKVSGQSSLSYVGHSQGTTMGFIGFEDPDLASKVNVFVALAPVAWLHHCGSILLTLLAKINDSIIYEVIGRRDFSPDTAELEKLLPELCTYEPNACKNIMSIIMGWDTSNLNSTMMPVFLAHEPSGTSVPNMIHYSQVVDAEVFQAFDYGPQGNMQHYNQTTPLTYHPERITIPIVLFSGGQDYLSDPTDVAQLVSVLKTVVYHKVIPSYAHLDFVWGTDAATEIYADVLKWIGTYNK